MSETPRSNQQVPAEIRRMISMVRGRMALGRFLAGLHDCLVIGLVVVLLLVLVAKTVPDFSPNWWLILSIVGGCSLFGGWLMARRARLSESAIAALIDERLQLRDRVSTALHCMGREDPFAQAALADAIEIARVPENRVRLYLLVLALCVFSAGLRV